jgi:hypothetical protein
VWNQPWCPGVTAAVSLPDACGVFTDEQAGALRVTRRNRTVDHPDHQECKFNVPQGQLTVILESYHPVKGKGSAKAADVLNTLTAQMDEPGRRLSGVGDEAWVGANAQGTTTYFDRSVVNLGRAPGERRPRHRVRRGAGARGDTERRGQRWPVNAGRH